jgi:hypothetical protein
VGFSYTEQDLIAALGPSRISPSLGLLDASGSGLVDCLGELGIAAENNGEATWEDVIGAAGYQPMVIGGRAWCHWVAVRMGPSAAPNAPPEIVLLMNPSPGYMEVSQTLNPFQFEELGPFSAVWFTSW